MNVVKKQLNWMFTKLQISDTYFLDQFNNHVLCMPFTSSLDRMNVCVYLISIAGVAKKTESCHNDWKIMFINVSNCFARIYLKGQNIDWYVHIDIIIIARVIHCLRCNRGCSLFIPRLQRAEPQAAWVGLWWSVTRPSLTTWAQEIVISLIMTQ